jgi:hypothetical protein
MANKLRVITIFFMITMVAFGNFNVIAQPGHPGGDMETETGVLEYSGDTNEGSSWDKNLNLEKELESQEEGLQLDGIMVLDIEFVLTWTDEESDSDPDEFSIMASDGMGEPLSDSSSGGTITVKKEGSMEGPPVNDTWDVTVTCVDAGDTINFPGPLGLLNEEDLGNSWELVITFSYIEAGGGMGGPPPNVTMVLESPIFAIHIALMVASVFLFLITGLVAGAFLFTRISTKSPAGFSSTMYKLFNPPVLLILLVIITFLAFFIASVPIGMWVAGNFYGWEKAWTGFPAIWNPEAFEMTNADNVSFIVLLFWFIPMYINRAQIMRSKYYKKLFGKIKFAMKRAEKAPDPIIPTSILALCYFFMGIFTFVIFEVQPHGSGS